MKIVVATDKFKHSLTSFEVCDAVEQGIKMVLPRSTVIKLPLSDGGDGIADVMAYYTPSHKCFVTVADPLFRPVETFYYLSLDGQTAFIEMAKASGLNLLQPNEFNCSTTSSYGTGELIKAAIEKGVKKIVLGIGGSATNDGGMGMAAALGYRFLDKAGRELKPIGANLIHLASIDTSHAIDARHIHIAVACDVTNYLTGAEGATYTYGPQKGANEKMLAQLEEGMKHFAAVVQRQLHVDMTSIKGGGAAGGMGAGCVTFLGAKLVSGIDTVFAYSMAEEAIKEADVVITGEGKIDAQTLYGKLIAGVTSLTKAHGKKVVAICGMLDITPEQQQQLGLTAAFSILDQPMPLQEAYQRAFDMVRKTAYNIACLL